MKGALAVVLALATLAPAGAPAATGMPEVRAVRLTTIDLRPAIRLLVSDDMPAGRLAREGREVVVRLPGRAVEGLVLPEVEPPLEGIRLVRPAEGATEVRVTVAPEVPFEATFEEGLFTVVFGASPDPGERGPITAELYQLLFPPAAAEGLEEEEEEEAEAPTGDRRGLYLGRVRLLPYLAVSYVDADILAFGPVPVRARYLEVTPGVTAQAPAFTGRLTLEYEPRLRFGSDIAEIDEPAHFAGVRLDLPVGSRTILRLGHRYTRATLETTVVDPGREYFFDLQRFTFNHSTVGARIDVGPSLVAELDAGWRWARFDETDEASGFFDYEGRAFRAGLSYDLRSDLRATVSYAYDHVPRPPDRPVAESTGHNVLATLEGEITPRTSGMVTVGLRHQINPLGVEGSRDLTGITASGTLRRQLGHSSRLSVGFTRTPNPSAFEENPFYLNNSMSATLEVPLPLELWGLGTVGYLRNSYPTESPAIGAPRRDEVWAWSVGIGRQLGWRTWVRADYRWEDRASNIETFDITINGFLVQFGIGRAGPGGGR